MINKIKAIPSFIKSTSIKYRNQYSTLFPHGILRRVFKKYPRYKSIRILIETGTFQGKTTLIESNYFNEVHTIELNKELYYSNLLKFELVPNIISYLGDSVEVLPQILKDIREDCVFFLDAHWSGDNSVDWSNSRWKGYGVNTSFRGDSWPPLNEQQCPLVQEAKVIGENYHRQGILIIDDWSVVGKKNISFEGEDWSHVTLEKIVDALGLHRVEKSFPIKYKSKTRMIVLFREME